jgi:adhesin transport system membrane fusion protein
MQATVDIHTGEKPVLRYLVQPVLKLRNEAFRER